ncbi:MAG: sulfate ABC transporter permease subunit CysT [Candidatus Marinimicrobia bacterium]|nr:sulfate ABC transporter permease subunit CysT [Candidatus Neomarinimicrobiota bacterium]MCF7902413.1 sulfate ABC transporter permease subunit CysT [Candidatus Neomarinimicrobiota bacterium]
MSERWNDLAQRSLMFFYLGLLILLPVAAITVASLQQGLYSLWENITTPQALYALRLTITTAIIMVVLNVVMGTLTAFVLVRYKFPGKNVMNALIDLPFAIPTVVTGIMLVILYGPHSVLGTMLSGWGIEVIFAKPGIILALLFVTYPFVVRAVQPVLQDLGPDMENAARTLGAGRIRIFFKVTLPALFPAILTGAALSFSRAMGEFGSIVVVAGNIPLKSQVAAVYIYGELESNNPQGALGLSVVLLIFSFLVLLGLNFLQRRKWQE